MILENEITDLKTEADALVPGIGQYLTGDTVLPDCPPDVLRELFAVLSVDQLNAVNASNNPYFSWFSACYALFLVGDYEFALAPFVDNPDTIAAITSTIERQKKNYTARNNGRNLTLTTFLSREGKRKTSYLDRTLQEERPRPVAPIPARRRSLYEMPTTQSVKFWIELLYGDLPTYSTRRKKVSNSSKITYKEKTVGKGTAEEKRVGQFVQTYPSGLVRSFHIDDVRLVAKGSKPGKTMLYQALKRLIHAPLDSEGHLQIEELHIPMRELVDNNVYSTINSARAGFSKGFDVLSVFTYSEHNRPTEPSDITVRPFLENKIENNIGIVYLSQNVDWRSILEEYSFVPDYFDSLSDFAQDLLFEIIVFARQNYQAIAKKNYFDIKIKTFQNNLDLPDEKKVHNPRRDIVEKIQAGLNEIEDAEAKRARRKDNKQPAIYFELSNMPTLEEHFDDYGVDASVSEYLDGRIRIHVEGDLADPLVKMNDTREKKIKQYRRKKAKQAAKKKVED